MRRVFVGFFIVLALAGTLAFGKSAISAQDTDMADHPLVGAWDLAADVGDGDTSCHSQIAFTDDGAYIEVSCDGFVSLGTWEPTGPNTANMTFVTGSPDDGYVKIRAAIEVAADGQSFTAPFTFEFIDPATGEGMGEYGPGMATGVRLVAEAPGTPIAPIPELFAQFEGTPEETPAA